MCWYPKPQLNIRWWLWDKAVTLVHVSWSTEARCVGPQGFTVCLFIDFLAREHVSTSECARTVRVGRLWDAPTQRCSRPAEGPGLCSITWRSEVTSSETADTRCIRSPSHTVNTFHSELPWAPGHISAENRLVWICSERIRFSSWVCICSIGAIINFAWAGVLTLPVFTSSA